MPASVAFKLKTLCATRQQIIDKLSMLRCGAWPLPATVRPGRGSRLDGRAAYYIVYNQWLELNFQDDGYIASRHESVAGAVGACRISAAILAIWLASDPIRL
ncbi:hypothetical protein PQU96_14405 [Vogesella sp. LYT5W]|uniref:Transposase n=1 Tax=Vogesella margarita TaxID=2984199 RepID=A0ABT5IRV5_9NEIS|nr:hypothetical protein [Vogesella margarita]MDC7715305.1 hypothetical protein [Vogesella margarita]